MAPHCPRSPVCHLAPMAPWMDSLCCSKTQCAFQYHTFVQYHVLLLNFVYFYVFPPKWNPKSLEDSDHVLCIFDLWEQGTMMFLELGRVQEIFVDQLIPNSRLQWVFTWINPKRILEEVWRQVTLSCHIYFVGEWRLHLIFGSNLDKKMLENSHEVRFSFKKAKHMDFKKKKEKPTLFLK